MKIMYDIKAFNHNEAKDEMIYKIPVYRIKEEDVYELTRP